MPDERTNILTRARTRETGIWAGFTFSGVDSTTAGVIATVYGIYGEAGLSMIEAIAGEKMALLVAEFAMKFNAVDADEANLAIDIASKTYAGQVDDAIFRQGLTTKGAKNASDQAYYTAQIAALESDRSKITTRQTELATHIQQVAAQIDVLLAQIDEESVSGQLVTIEVAQKQLAVQEEALKRLQIAIDVLEVRRRINEVTLDQAKAEAEVVELGARFVELQSQGGDIALLAAEIQNRITVAGLELSHVGVAVTESGNRLKAAQTDLLEMDAQAKELTANATRAGAQQQLLATDAMQFSVEINQTAIGVKDLNGAAVRRLMVGQDAVSVANERAHAAVMTAKMDTILAAKKRNMWASMYSGLLHVSAQIETLKAKKGDTYGENIKEALSQYRLDQWKSKILPELGWKMMGRFQAAKAEAEGVAERAAQLMTGV